MQGYPISRHQLARELRMVAQRLTRGRERRRHERIAVDFDALVIGADNRELTVKVLDVSRGGVQLARPAELKGLLFRPKRYTHSPLPALLRLPQCGTARSETLLGRCRYLRKMPDGSYRIGFGFAQLQPQRWLDAVAATCQTAIPGHALRQHQRQNPHPG